MRWRRRPIGYSTTPPPVRGAGPKFCEPPRSVLTSWWRSLRAGELAHPHQIKPVRTMLENQRRDNLLAFTVQLDRDLENLS